MTLLLHVHDLVVGSQSGVQECRIISTDRNRKPQQRRYEPFCPLVGSLPETGAAAFESVGLWSYMLGTGSQSGTRVGNTSGSDPVSGSGSGLGNGVGSGGDGAFIRKSWICHFIYSPMPRCRSRLSGQAEPICWPEIDYRFQEWLRLVGEFFASPPPGRTFTSGRS